jgi:hypothetical protein
MIPFLVSCLIACQPRDTVVRPEDVSPSGSTPPSPAAPEPVAQIVWVPIQPKDPCERAEVGTRAALFWHDDAAGTIGVVDLDGEVVAREESRVGIRVKGSLPDRTRPVPSYVFHEASSPECAARTRRLR